MLCRNMWGQLRVIMCVWPSAQVEPLRLGGTEDRQKLHDELVKDLQASMGLNSLIFTMTQKAPKLVGAELCTVYLCDYAKQELWSVATGSGEEFRIPINEGLAGTVATNMEVINIPDCYADPRWKGHEFDQATGFTTRNMLVFPIAQFENSTRVGESSKPVSTRACLRARCRDERPYLSLGTLLLSSYGRNMHD